MTAVPRRALAAWPPLVPVVVVILLWWAAAALYQNAAFPSPAEAASSLTASLQNPRFLTALGETVSVTVLAYGTALLVGLIFGCVFGLTKRVGVVGGALLYAFNSMPKLVLYPIFLLALGLNTTSRFAFGAFHGVFIISIVVMEAVRGRDPLFDKVGSALRMTPLQRVRLLLVPALLPFVAVGARLCFSFTFLGVIVAELLSAHGGLGEQIVRRVETGRIDEIVGIVALIFMIALLPALLIQAVENRLTRYQRV